MQPIADHRYLLNARFKQQQIIIWNGKGGVQDRTIYEDSIFAKVGHFSTYLCSRPTQTIHRVQTLSFEVAFANMFCVERVNMSELATAVMSADVIRKRIHGTA